MFVARTDCGVIQPLMHVNWPAQWEAKFQRGASGDVIVNQTAILAEVPAGQPAPAS